VIDSGRIEAAVAELLAAIGEDASRPGLAATPTRVAESYREFFAGLERDPLEPLRAAEVGAGASAMDEGLSPRGVLVVLDARHSCVTARGPRQVDSSIVTIASRGALSNPVNRAEAMGLISAGSGALE